MAKRHLSEATKRKIGSAQKGKKNSMYGRRHSKAALAKIASASRGKSNPMYGKHHSPETIKKLRLIALKRHRSLTK